MSQKTDEKSIPNLDPHRVAMIDISEKPTIKRIATAAGRIYLKTSTISKIQEGTIKKGDPLTVGRVAALLAVKKTPDLIPLCHQIPISRISFSSDISSNFIEVSVTVTTLAPTGVEMEALVGVTTFLSNIWDMTKYLEKDENGQYPETRMESIRVVKKIKGQIED